jgi:hypothetical protein
MEGIDRKGKREVNERKRKYLITSFFVEAQTYQNG